MGKKWKWSEEQKMAHSIRLKKSWAQRQQAKMTFWQKIMTKIKRFF